MVVEADGAGVKWEIGKVLKQRNMCGQRAWLWLYHLVEEEMNRVLVEFERENLQERHIVGQNLAIV